MVAAYRIAEPLEYPNSLEEAQLVVKFAAFQRIRVAADLPKHGFDAQSLENCHINCIRTAIHSSNLDCFYYL